MSDTQQIIIITLLHIKYKILQKSMDYFFKQGSFENYKFCSIDDALVERYAAKVIKFSLYKNLTHFIFF